MSKKKAFSGSTMTLKDFHGGSIPSDIPLPSAPGVITRPTDRPGSGFDRQGSWGNPMGRSDQRLRPSSSGSMRSFDDKTTFLTSTVHIGRNFDEDERKPLDGSSVPRRTVSDDPIGAPSMRMEPKSDVGRFMGHQGSVPMSQQAYSSNGGTYSSRIPEAVHTGSTSRNPSAGHGVCGGTHPNAWAARKEVIGETAASPYVGQSNVSKFAHASALDKVSSGRWQTKPVQHQADVEVIRQVESPNGLHPRGSDAYHGFNSMNERDYSEKMLVGRGLALEESVQIVRKEAPIGQRVRSPIFLDAKERASVSLTGNVQPHPDGKYGISGSQVHAEALERPKLKLLPRSKPLEAPEVPPAEYKQNIQQASDITHMEISHETIVNDSHIKTGLNAGVEDGNQPIERPKLNLKPRSQPVEQTEETAERLRLALFGGARPRELVLKDRGVDDVGNSQDVVQSPVRAKKDSPPVESMLVHSIAFRSNERLENTNLDHKTGKGTDRREQRTETEKTEPQRKNWRNENWRNSRDAEKQQNQVQHHQEEKERPPSPDTWRKPVEQPKPTNSDAGLRFGKAVSAVELAQAFSKSVSDPKQKNTGPFSSPKGIPARTQVPFSRLTGSSSRPQINGY
ncbi:hypothetical protein V2J09_020972 [Rumex salicifolius]